MSSEATVVASLIDGQAGWSLGTNLFLHPEQPADSYIPVNAVFVYATDGFQPRPYMGRSKEFRQVMVEVKVRAAPDAFQAGEAQAEAIYKRVHLASSATTGVTWVKCMYSKPIHPGDSKEDFNIWMLRFNVGEEVTIISP